ncbi:ATP-binding protein [Pseudomonas canadensis]|uniref:ATP-binding protein n=1 Tax=Pseudomonas canadensis TaxID=915099 RepID=UPI002736A511|nr:ATP-binding protein [Pseudomonas canadensis]WLH29944.1 ATP-binding protein [Pseudomonas canadensis]
MTLLLGSLCCATLLAYADHPHAALEFTPDERAWIETHPVLRVAALENLSPIEYLEDGNLKGLSAEYLQFIALKTGLRLEFIPAHSIEDRIELMMSGKADLISTLRLNGPNGSDPRLLYTTHYLNTTAVVVTRTHHPPILASDQLNGMTVTLPYFDRYRDVVTARAPNAKLIIGGGAMAMLQQVADGTADAAVATEAYLMPYLYKEFQGQLQISGVLTDMVSKIGMSTRADQFVLHSIIQKVLDSMTLDEVRAIHASWIEDHATRNLALSEITDHYPHEVGLAAVVLLLLLGVTYQTHRMRQRAERNEREKAMFLAVMSHEIRSPMNAVLAAVELLHNTPLDKQQQHFVGLAGSGAQSLLTLLDDVLDLSKLDAGQLKLELEPVNLASLVQNVTDLHSLRARERHLSISVVGESQVPALMLDGTRLGQVLHNLLSNAIKFTETGGIEVSYLITDTSTSGLKHIRIAVSDTGIGICPEAQQRLFQPYSQAARSYRRSGGTGLGLVICRDLLKLMKGGVTLESEVGKGTRMEISLVAEVAPAMAVEAPVSPPGFASTRNLRILVVEDTPANQAVLQAQIEGFGCTAIIARDGTQAMDCFEQSSYDLILMDCDLPDQDGYSVTRLFRMIERDAEQPPCPIVAISASSDNEHISRCFDAGMDGILGKPISLGKLQDTIELWCNVSLTLVPRPFTDHVLMADPRIVEALEQDLLALLEAITLHQLEPARHAAHRLHGAALSIEWPGVACEADALEALLKAATPWQEPAYATALQGLIRALRSPAPKASPQTEPIPQSSV